MLHLCVRCQLDQASAIGSLGVDLSHWSSMIVGDHFAKSSLCVQGNGATGMRVFADGWLLKVGFEDGADPGRRIKPNYASNRAWLSVGSTGDASKALKVWLITAGTLSKDAASGLASGMGRCRSVRRVDLQELIIRTAKAVVVLSTVRVGGRPFTG